MRSPRRHCALCLALLALLGGCRKPNQLVVPPPPAVTVAHPTLQSVTDKIEFVGTLEPTQVVNLRARVNGYLQAILFKDGSNVEAGQELFLIEPTQYQSVLDAAKAANQRAVASLGLAKSQYRRMEPLRASGVVTQEELDVQSAQVETSQADVAAAEAAVRKAELDLSYTRVTAPIAGRIGRHMVDVGNLVRAEETELAVIRVIDPIYAIFDVSENDLLKFMAMRRNDELPDPEAKPPVLHLALGNEEGFPHEGQLDYREMIVGTQTGTARRRAIFPNPGSQLIPGMQIRIQADVGEAKPKLLIDERAIGSDQRGDYVLIVNSKNVVEYKPVKLGIHVGDQRVIESGLQANDSVVVNGLQRARPGATVKPETEEEQAAAAEKTKAGATPPAATPASSAAKKENEAAPKTEAAPAPAEKADAATEEK